MTITDEVHVLDNYHSDAIALLQSNKSINTVLPSDLQNLHGATGILVRSETRVDDEILQSAPQLRVIVKQGVGVDNIDLDAARRHGVRVYNTPGLNSESVAELTIALVLSLSRRVCEINARIKRGELVVRSETLGTSLFGKTIGIIGMGNIGLAVAQKWLGAMQGKVVTYDPYSKGWNVPHQKVDELAELLQASDVVSLHLPLTDSTRGLIGTREFQTMKTGAILVNCARGGIVNEDALYLALREGQILGAALDAVEVEPPTQKIYHKLCSCDNLIITPHIGASTVENQSISGRAVVQTLFDALQGKDLPNRLA